MVMQGDFRWKCWEGGQELGLEGLQKASRWRGREKGERGSQEGGRGTCTYTHTHTPGLTGTLANQEPSPGVTMAP